LAAAQEIGQDNEKLQQLLGSASAKRDGGR
jgi:hypothetical protein